MTNEVIVRELSASVANLVAMTPGDSESRNNVARFFNDTPFDLDLVAVRIGAIASILMSSGNVELLAQLFVVAELSRQAEAGQQEGIIANVRGFYTSHKDTVANGGNAVTANIGELVFGDFKTPLMTLEVQTNLFLHAVLTNIADSVTTLAIGDAGASIGCTLYFKRRSSRRR